MSARGSLQNESRDHDRHEWVNAEGRRMATITPANMIAKPTTPTMIPTYEASTSERKSITPTMRPIRPATTSRAPYTRLR